MASTAGKSDKEPTDMRHFSDINTLEDFFNAGMDRNINLFDGPAGRQRLNLGAGHQKVLDNCIPLDLPEWNAEVDDLPYRDGSITDIYAFHFFEHISTKRVPRLLKECERVLCAGGTLNIVVPHRLGGMAWQDLDHKSFYTEDTWRILMINPYYQSHPDLTWRLKLNLNLIMGDSERTLALFTRFIKE